MRYLMIIILLISLSDVSYGQQGKMKQKIEAARIALITERLNLSPAEAEKFWPVYNQFTSERKMLRESYKKERIDIDKENITEEQRKEFLRNEIAYKQKELNLEKEYSQKVLDVISTEQLVSLRGAERDFRRMLLERVQRSRGSKMQQGQQMRDRQKRLRNNN